MVTMPISTWHTPRVFSSTEATPASLIFCASTSDSRSASMTPRASTPRARSSRMSASRSVVLPAPGLAMTSTKNVPSWARSARKASAASSLAARMFFFTSMTRV